MKRANTQLELRQASATKDNKKHVFKYISSRRNGQGESLSFTGYRGKYKLSREVVELPSQEVIERHGV